MNHHYVPQFYLRQFSFEAGKPTKIWRYRLDQEPRFSAIKSTGSKEDLYSFRRDDGTLDDTTVEDQLTRLEDEAAKGLRGAVFQEQRIPDEIRNLLSIFLSASIRRTPKFKEKQDPMVRAFVTEMRTEKKQRELARSFLKKTYPDISEEDLLAGIEFFKPHLNEKMNAIPDAPDYVHPNLITAQDSAVPGAIASMCWTFLKAPDQQKFITSDNPVAYTNGLGISHKDAVVLWPVSKDYLLRTTNQAPTSQLYQPVSVAQVQHLNNTTLRNAHKELYAGYRSAELARAFNTELRNRTA